MSSHDPAEKRRGLFWVTLSYILAIGAGVGVALLLPEESVILRFALADVMATIVIFIFALIFNNSSFYDPYWSVIPIVIGLALILFFSVPEVNVIRQWAAMALVTAWGARLTYNWARGWTGLDHEDWRYVDLQKKTGSMYWWVSFSGIMMFPTVLVFLGCIPLFYALTTSSAPFGIFDVLGIIWAGGGTLIEGISDNQLRKFRLTNTEKGKIMESGLWAYSRHPNYFGEISFWWGLFFFGMAAAPQFWYWNIIGAVAMTALFVFISIPMIDKRSVERRPHYAEHMKKVSGLVPWFPKKA